MNLSLIKILFILCLICYPLFINAQSAAVSPDTILAYGQNLINKIKSPLLEKDVYHRNYTVRYVPSDYYSETCDFFKIILEEKSLSLSVPVDSHSFSKSNYFYDLFNKSLDEEIDCYNYDGSKALSTKELNSLKFIDKTFTIFDPVDKSLKKVIKQNPRPFGEVHSISLIEEWFWENNGQLKMQIKAIAPSRTMYDDKTGDYLGVEILCWYVFK